MNYRAEIDGLRALEGILVIFYHAGFELFKGGFVGVDVFIDDGHLTKKASKIIGDEFNLANMIIKNAS